MPTQASALLQDAPPTVTRAEMPLAAVGNLRPFQFEPFGDEPDHSPLDSVANIELPLSVELGHGEVSCSQHPGSGAVLVLKQTPNEPVDLLVNGRRIARGEILVLDDKFCVRITELTPRGERSEETGKTRSADVMTGEVIPDDRG